MTSFFFLVRLEFKNLLFSWKRLLLSLTFKIYFSVEFLFSALIFIIIFSWLTLDLICSFQVSKMEALVIDL